MLSIQVGSTILNGQLLLILAFGAAGWAAVRLFRHTRTIGHDFGFLTTDAFLIWLLLWKASLLLIDPAMTLRHPLSLLYFDGGEQGRLLAWAAAAGYAYYRTRRMRIAERTALQAAGACVLGGTAAYQAGLALIDAASWGEHAAIAVAAVVLALPLWLPDRRLPRTVNRGNLATTLVVLVLLAYMLAGAFTQGSGSTASGAANADMGIRIGQRAPDFTLTDLDGREVRLSDYRGRTVLVNFWATWCPPCRAEMPHLQRFYERRSPAEADVLAVNLTYTESSPGKAQAFAAKHGLTFPIALDGNGAVAELYDIVGYPTTYVVDGEGIIRAVYRGAIDERTMGKI